MKRAFRIINSSQSKFPKMFNSTARALEYAEEQVLKHEHKDMDYRVSSPVIFEENDLCKDIDQHGIALLKKISQKQKYKSREVVLAEGDENRMLYLVTSLNSWFQQLQRSTTDNCSLICCYPCNPSPGRVFPENLADCLF